MSTLSRAIVLLFASTSTAAACDIVQPVGCDTSWAATIAGNDQLTYDCDPYLWDGDDLAVSFAADSDQLIRIDIRPGIWSNEPDVFVTENGCNGTCLAQSDDPTLDNTTVFPTTCSILTTTRTSPASLVPATTLSSTSGAPMARVIRFSTYKQTLAAALRSLARPH